MNFTLDMSFREKSAWASFIITLVIFGNYFYELSGFAALDQQAAKDAALSLLARSIVAVIVLEILIHSLIAAMDSKAAEAAADEREQAIASKANHYGYYLLSATVLMVIGRMLLLEFFPERADSSIELPMLTLHLLMLGFILSELLRFGSQIWAYRRSAL
ncbi:MAG: hypothetical protein OIF38_15015 [Cellvibrionaceae bacterium]|nr:hypothetical protein [Cellvibrionaceae bacterium]